MTSAVERAKERYRTMRISTEMSLESGRDSFGIKLTKEELDLIKSVFPMDEKTWEIAFNQQSFFSECMLDAVLEFAKNGEFTGTTDPISVAEIREQYAYKIS